MAHKTIEERREYARQWREKNRESMNSYHRQWRASNRHKVMTYMRKCAYGVTPLDIYTLRKMQNNRCAICGEEERRVLRGKVKDLCVDHDHETGQVRGLLCDSCNVMIGRAKESTDNLQKAIAYLEKHR